MPSSRRAEDQVLDACEYPAEGAQLPDVRLVSLQQGPGTEQIDTVPWRDRLVHLGEEIDRDGAFLDSAAILSSVDLVVTSDTALAHLAGAMDVPVWLALSQAPVPNALMNYGLDFSGDQYEASTLVLAPT